ncbi:hypothetical protein [Streptomyces sp. IB201691-2A2]|uniref:hypothetical protein n=1 Tax=Streptomyces sp. IB201691-2A2 TaxID=2561920 RepID=UPI00117FDAE5|nr:hypothetical protein [Streptomyces sp. IB201691-2A2]TRO56328.1 hypothetical protein E4K73_47030 [Streptomyces sp. IB201691-2A2]
MTTPRITDALSSLTAGGLTAIRDIPWWIMVLILLPALLGAATRTVTAVLASISNFRKESLWTNREKGFLDGVDTTTGLLHIEHVRRSAALASTQLTTELAPTSQADNTPPPGPPP